VIRLMAKHGDAALTDLLGFLTAKCQKRAAFSVYDQCKAHYGPVERKSAPRLAAWER
jgi:hypothetical protein